MITDYQRWMLEVDQNGRAIVVHTAHLVVQTLALIRQASPDTKIVCEAEMFWRDLAEGQVTSKAVARRGALQEALKWVRFTRSPKASDRHVVQLEALIAAKPEA